jgi:hypothetical protein
MGNYYGGSEREGRKGIGGGLREIGGGRESERVEKV